MTKVTKVTSPRACVVMKKMRLKNQAVGPFPGMIVGAMLNEKPTYTTVGAGGCASLEPVLCVSLKNTHYIRLSAIIRIKIKVMPQYRK